MLLIIIALIYLVWFLKEKRLEAKREAETKQRIQRGMEKLGQITKMLDDYVQKSNPTAEETKAVWAKYMAEYNDLFGNSNGSISKGTEREPIPHVFTDAGRSVYGLMNGYLGNHDTREKAGEVRKEFTLKLWNFYYHIAFRFDLDPVDQGNLLDYLVRCFRAEYRTRGDFGDYQGSYGPKSHDLPYEIEEWNEKLLKLLEEGCNKDNAAALRCLAWCYYEKVAVDLRDYNKAFALYQQAAQLGDIHSVYMLGKCYENGHGTKRNPQKAGDCYQYAYDLSKEKRYADALDKLYTAQKWDKNRYSSDIFTNNMAVMKKDDLETIREKLSKYAQADLDTAELRVLAVSVGMLQEDVVNSFIACYESASIKDGQSDKINLLRNKGHFTDEIANKAHTVRKLRNRGAHDDDHAEPIKVEEVRTAISYMKEIVEYYAAY